MTTPQVFEQPTTPDAVRTARRQTVDGARVAVVVTGSLAILGALLGLVWAWWSPPGPLAEIFPGGGIQPDENEAFIQQDGRFLAISAAVGLVAGVLLWTRTRTRGPMVVAALGIGSLLGSLAMWWIGHLAGGGDGTGKLYRYTDGTTHRISKQLPLTVHLHGVLFVQAAVAVLVYTLCVAFAKSDDLGRPDDVRDALRPQPPQPGYPQPGYPQAGGSVHPGDQSQGGWGDRDAPRPLQQGDLPPQ